MIQFPLGKIESFSIELIDLLEKYHYKLTTFNTSSGKKVVIVDNSIHPTKIVGYLTPDAEKLVTEIAVK